MTSRTAVLRFVDVRLVLDGTVALDGVTWSVTAGERWIVLGPNGSGKTSLVRLASGYHHPTTGAVEVLGHRLGRVDVRRLRRRIGLASASLARQLRPGITALDVVLAGRHAALETWWHSYDDADRERAGHLLAGAGLAELAGRAFGVLSEGERQQVQLARTLMGDPELVLLDEPAAGLDMGGRERLVTRLGELAVDPGTPPVVFVTHHVEEIPAAFTHALLLRQGRVVAAGPLGATLTDDTLSEAFGLSLRLSHQDGRWSCRAAT